MEKLLTKSDGTALTFQRFGFCEETGAAAAKDELILLGRLLNVTSLSWKLTECSFEGRQGVKEKKEKKPTSS